MTAAQPHFVPHPALVVKGDGASSLGNRYLQLTPAGEAVWVDDPAVATEFPSMREAMRTALRLPSGLRAFGLPREPEIALRRAA